MAEENYKSRRYGLISTYSGWRKYKKKNPLPATGKRRNKRKSGRPFGLEEECEARPCLSMFSSGSFMGFLWSLLEFAKVGSSRLDTRMQQWY